MSGVHAFIDFGGRWVVVTGGSSGLGRAVALELGRRSARLLLVGRNEAKLVETQRQLPEGCGRVVIQGSIRVSQRYFWAFRGFS